jgi:hypothetical protein
MPSTRPSPTRSLQKLRTVFSQTPSRNGSTAEPASPSPLTLSNTINISNPSTRTSPSTTTNLSPLSSPTLTLTPTVSPTPSSGFAGFAGFNFGNAAPSPLFNSPESFFPDPTTAIDSRRVIRRKKSCVEIEIERERYEVDGKLVGVVEPRPVFGLGMGFNFVSVGGIEEVLCGEV